LETKLDLFKFKQYESEIILLTVRWYLKYSLSYRNLAEMMGERGLHMAHTTIMRWIHQFGPELDKRINDSFRTDETYIKVKGEWKYLYRAQTTKSRISLIICNCCTRTNFPYLTGFGWRGIFISKLKHKAYNISHELR
jgi:transposase-like protein